MELMFLKKTILQWFKKKCKNVKKVVNTIDKRKYNAKLIVQSPSVHFVSVLKVEINATKQQKLQSPSGPLATEI